MSQAGPLNAKGGGGGGSPIMTLTGDTGGPVPPTGNNVNVIAGNSSQNSGSSVLIAGNPGTSTLTLDVTDVNSNTIIGESAGNASITGTDNTGLGEFSLRALTSGIRNTGIGYQSLNTLQGGNFNVGLGYNALLTVLSGGANTAVGTQALTSVNTGNFNTALGYQAGQNYTTSESANISISNPGVLGESHVLRVGVSGSGTQQVNKAFIAGINGVTVSNPLMVVLNSATEQLGTQAITLGTVRTLTGNSGGAVSPDAGGNISTVGTGSITVVGNPGANSLTAQLTGLTNHSLLVGAGTATITNLGVATNGQLPIGSGGADPVLATLTPGTGIAITNGAGSITITATAAGFVWSDQAVSFAAVKENGYFIIGNATATLPAVPANGDTIKFFVDGAFTLTLQANTGQTIKFATSVSSTAGTFVNTASGDACELVYRSTNTQWNCIDFVGGWNHT